MLAFPDFAVPKEGTKGLNLYWDILTKVELNDTIIRAQRDMNEYCYGTKTEFGVLVINYTFTCT